MVETRNPEKRAKKKKKNRKNIEKGKREMEQKLNHGDKS